MPSSTTTANAAITTYWTSKEKENQKLKGKIICKAGTETSFRLVGMLRQLTVGKHHLKRTQSTKEQMF